MNTDQYTEKLFNKFKSIKSIKLEDGTYQIRVNQKDKYVIFKKGKKIIPYHISELYHRWILNEYNQLEYLKRNIVTNEETPTPPAKITYNSGSQHSFPK